MSQPAFRPLRQAKVILASASPRRTMLLGQVGLSPEVVPSDVEEVVVPHFTPAEVVESLAYQKAAEVALRRTDADLVIGADTVVVLDGKILGKPVDREDARRTLSRLSGSWHQVYTGFALISPKNGRTVTGHATTEVRFRTISPQEIEAYIDTGEPMDKAGSYGIQELASVMVAEIRGDYSNVVGLPMPSLDAAWRELGWSVL